MSALENSLYVEEAGVLCSSIEASKHVAKKYDMSQDSGYVGSSIEVRRASFEVIVGDGTSKKKSHIHRRSISNIRGGKTFVSTSSVRRMDAPSRVLGEEENEISKHGVLIFGENPRKRELRISRPRGNRQSLLRSQKLSSVEKSQGRKSSSGVEVKKSADKSVVKFHLYLSLLLITGVIAITFMISRFGTGLLMGDTQSVQLTKNMSVYELALSNGGEEGLDYQISQIMKINGINANSQILAGDIVTVPAR